MLQGIKQRAERLAAQEQAKRDPLPIP